MAWRQHGSSFTTYNSAEAMAFNCGETATATIAVQGFTHRKGS